MGWRADYQAYARPRIPDRPTHRCLNDRDGYYDSKNADKEELVIGGLLTLERGSRVVFAVTK